MKRTSSIKIYVIVITLIYPILSWADKFLLDSPMPSDSEQEKNAETDGVVNPQVVIGQTKIKEPELPELSSGATTDNDKHSFIDIDKVEGFVAQQSARLGAKYSKSNSDESRESLLSKKNEISNDITQQKEIDYWKELAQNEVKSVVNESINDGANKLLSSFGTSETSITLDRDYSISTYSSDVLIPIDKDENSMLFIQGGLRKGKQDRKHVNFGFGKRYFLEEYSLGLNSFLDHDYSRHHTRMSLGGEYFSDYIKVGANSYIPLSKWRSSPDVIDYLERPSYGIDLRVNGYIPAYPQVGVKSIVEFYSGSEVDILSNGNRASDPYAVTMGLNYTPIPLLTFSVDHIMAKSAQQNTAIEARFNWQLGSSWADMIKPQNVSISRSLEGLVMGLVDRNNEIVLKYKQDESVLQVSLPEKTTISELDELILEPEVKGSSLSKTYVWSGDIIQNVENKFSSKLYIPSVPAFIKGGSNTYYATVVVSDPRKNTREATTAIEVIENENLSPSVRLKDRNVKLKLGSEYQLDWIVFDPRDPECTTGCDKAYAGHKVNIEMPMGIVSQYDKLSIKADVVGGPLDLTLKITLPSGHEIQDSMTVEVVDDTDSKNNEEMTIELIELDLDENIISNPLAGKVILKAKLSCNGNDCNQNNRTVNTYLWQRKSTVYDDEWHDVVMTTDDTYRPKGGPGGGDQGYTFRAVLVSEQDIAE